MKKRLNLIIEESEGKLVEWIELTVGGITDVKDITALMEPSQYRDLPRMGVAAELDKTMPKETHQSVSVVFPRLEGETRYDWTIRVWSHPIISIISSNFKWQWPPCGSDARLSTM